MILSVSHSPNTNVPTAEEAAIALESRQIVTSYLHQEKSSYTIKVISDGTVGEAVTLPAEALCLLVEILAQMAQGNAVKIVPIKKEFSISEAADLLNVSRPYLVDLLESGQIPFRQVGNRRRILSEDAIAYKNRIDAQREQTLAELAAQAQELNMGYE